MMPVLRAAPLLLLVCPGVALAHGSGLLLIVFGIPFAICAYLIGAGLLIRSAVPGRRWRRARLLALAFPYGWQRLSAPGSVTGNIS